MIFPLYFLEYREWIEISLKLDKIVFKLLAPQIPDFPKDARRYPEI